MKKTCNRITLTVAGLLFVPLTAFAACSVDPKGGVQLCDTNDNNIATVINNVIGWILGFAGALAVLMIIYGGVVYLTSAGNEKRVSLGKQILTYAIIGLIVVLLAEVIVVLVGNAMQLAQSGS